jgi:hypothetical protein
MKDQIIFDTTDSDTIADSDKILSGVISTDGSTLITDTTEGAKQGLDVYVINPSLDVNLQAGDGTDITQTGGALDVNIASGSITVVESDVYAEDSAHTTGDEGAFNLSIRIDDISAANTAFLAGTEGDYQGTFTNDNGELYVKATDTDALLTTMDAVLDSIKVDTGSMSTDLTTIAGDTTSLDALLTALSKAEDSVHVSGDQGFMGLAVRNDTLETLTDTDGDYAPFQVNADGALYVAVDGGITTSDAALANVAIANAVNTLAVAATAEDLVASPLTDRKYLYAYNNDNQRMYIGATGVTAANGFPVAPRSYMELRAGAAIDIEFVSPKVGHEIRTMELS